jgi:hypothetical protein
VRVGPKVFNEAGSRCCNIAKIVETYISSAGSGAYASDLQNTFLTISRLGIKYLAKQNKDKIAIKQGTGASTRKYSMLNTNSDALV